MHSASDHGYTTGSTACIACGSPELGCCDGKGNPLVRIFVYQDGANFYRDDSDDPAEAAKRPELPAHLWAAPFPVTDHDVAAAEAARNLFRDWCAARTFWPVF